MVNKHIKILLVVLLTFAFTSNARRERAYNISGDIPELKVECVMPEQDFFEGQPVPLTITLFSSTPDVAFANHHSLPPSLAGGEFATRQTISPAGNAYEKNVDGKVWYCFPLEAYMVTVDEKGRYEFGGGSYTVGVNFPEVVNDPFWGRMRTNRVQEFDVAVNKTKFRVKSVPAPPVGIDYSGSVGTFTIETVVPEGDIYLGEEATAYIILKGSGMIAESTLPEYRNCFVKGIRLKSLSESRNEGHDTKGRMLSEIRLECTFIPTERDDAEIGEARFDFFNPNTGKYQTVKSKPVKIKVKSTASKRETLEI